MLPVSVSLEIPVPVHYTVLYLVPYCCRASSGSTTGGAGVVTMGRTIATTTLTAAQLQQLAAAKGQVSADLVWTIQTIINSC
jgi:hypothetical protein